jgi:hypothetical protein
MVRTAVAVAVGTTLFMSTLAWGESTLTLSKPTVHPGESIKVRATFPNSHGPIRSAAALGSIGPFAAVGGGVFEADFTAPQQPGPAQVLIAAFEDSADGGLVTAFVNVEDTVTEKIKTKGNGPVFVHAGANRAGPFHPSKKGEVTVTFSASGELNEADLESPQGKKLDSVPIKVNRVRTLVIGRPTRIRPTDHEPAEVLLLAPGDEHLRNDALKATGTESRLTLEGSPGVGGAAVAARFKFSPSVMATADFQIKIIDSAGHLVGTTTLALAGAKIANIALKTPNKALGAGELATVSIRLSDKDGKPADGDILVNIDSGELTPPLPMATGLYTVSYTAPTKLPAGGVAHLTVKAVLGGKDAPVVSNAEISLHGGKASKVVFDGLPAGLKAGEEVPVKLHVFDSDGNPAKPEGLTVSADRGEISGLAAAGDGSYTGHYKAPSSLDDAADVVFEAHDGAARLDGDQHLHLLPQEVETRVLVGPSGGFTNNLGHVSTVSVSAVAVARIYSLASAGIDVGYLPGLSQKLAANGGQSGTLSLARIPIHLRLGALYLSGPFEVHGGLEGGPTYLSGTLTAEGQSLSLQGWHFEYGVYAGGGYKLGPGFLGIEVRGSQALLNVSNARLSVHGSVGGVNGVVGYLIAI